MKKKMLSLMMAGILAVTVLGANGLSAEELTSGGEESVSELLISGENGSGKEELDSAGPLAGESDYSAEAPGQLIPIFEEDAGETGDSLLLEEEEESEEAELLEEEEEKPELLLPEEETAEETGANQQCGDEAYWSLNRNTGILTITGKGAIWGYHEVYDENTDEVTGIDSPWYEHERSIRAVMVSPGITRVGVYAFSRLSNLIAVEVADTVEEIGFNAFSDCRNLQKVQLNDSVTEIDNCAFQNDVKLNEIHLSAELQRIEGFVFENCISLSKIEFPGKLKSVSSCAFAGCSALTEAVLPDGLTYLGWHAFYNCTMLQTAVVPDTCTNTYRAAFEGCSALRRVKLSEGEAKVQAKLFAGCSALTTVSIPKGVTEIEYEVFLNCTSLRKIDIPSFVQSIGIDTFRNCSRLGEIRFYGNAPAVIVKDGYWGAYPGRDTSIVNIFEGVTAIGYYPKGNKTWTEAVRAGYGGNITWVEWEPIRAGRRPFRDIREGKFYYNPVYWAYERGITTGIAEDSFAPEDTCTREQIVTFLWRMKGSPKPKSGVNFSDVKKDSWYYDAVCWAFENNITTGLKDEKNSFGVGQPCTRAMCVTFLHRAAGEPALAAAGTTFSDVERGKYYEQAVAWAQQQGITTGYKNPDGSLTGIFGVKDNCKRGEIVTFLYRYAGEE